jgi:hypothetical protein
MRALARIPDFFAKPHILSAGISAGREMQDQEHFACGLLSDLRTYRR